MIPTMQMHEVPWVMLFNIALSLTLNFILWRVCQLLRRQDIIKVQELTKMNAYLITQNADLLKRNSELETKNPYRG